MTGLKQQIDSAFATGIAAIAAAALGLLGVVWLTVALAAALGQFLPGYAAMAAVGGACLGPLVVLLAMRRRNRPPPPPEKESGTSPEAALSFDRLSGSIDAISRTSPIGAVGVAFGAAWIASRSPHGAAISAALSQEAIERLVALVATLSAPSEQSSDTPAPPD